MKKFKPTQTARVTAQYCRAMGLGPRRATDTHLQREQVIGEAIPATATENPASIAQPTQGTLMPHSTDIETGSPIATNSVVNFMTNQLLGKPRPAPLPIDAAGQNDMDDKEGADKLPGSRAAGNAVLRKVLGRRFVSARELAGLGQTESALSIGWVNSTQLSLIERGDRLPPHEILRRAASLYGVSTDYLLGLSDEPERDVLAASRNGALRRMQGLLETNARAVTEALLYAVKGDTTTELRSIKFVSEIEALLNGIDAFQASNSDVFDELRSGAMLVRRARDARQALQKVVNVMENLDRRAACAVERARQAMEAASLQEIDFKEPTSRTA